MTNEDEDGPYGWFSESLLGDSSNPVAGPSTGIAVQNTIIPPWATSPVPQPVSSNLPTFGQEEWSDVEITSPEVYYNSMTEDTLRILTGLIREAVSGRIAGNAMVPRRLQQVAAKLTYILHRALILLMSLARIPHMY